MNKETHESRLGKLGFIGAGKVGTALGKYLSLNGATISGYYSLHVTSAKEAAKHTGSTAFAELNDLIASSDTLFITVPDGEISGVWDRMREADLNGKIVIHTSGACTIAQLSGITDSGAFGFSLHPLCAVSDRFTSHEALSKAVFTIEYDENKNEEAYLSIVRMMENAGNTVIPIKSEDKPRYHAAAVMASNMVVGLSYTAEQMLKSVGFDEESAGKALMPLIKGAVDNILRQGSIDALTGPVERNDVTTVRKHMDVLNDGESAIYKSLTKVLVEIAGQKHKDVDYSEISRCLSPEY